MFAGKLKGEAKPAATHFYLQQPDPFGPSHLLRAIDNMVQTGRQLSGGATLLTTGSRRGDDQ